MSDYKIPYNSLEQFIPSNLANVMNVSLMQTVFDKMLTKEESIRMYGVIGDKSTPTLEGKPFISEGTADRYFNSLCPVLYYKIGAEENVFTFKDMLNKASLMGIDTNEFGTWGQVKKLNFTPPINIDKFVNFSQYFWIQSSLPNQSYGSNPTNLPEYYTIARPAINDTIKFPVDVGTTTNIELNGTLEVLGDWKLRFTDSTHFTITSPSGVIENGSTTSSSTFSNNYLEFTIISRSINFSTGDEFTLTLYPLTSTPTSISFIGNGNGYLTNVISKLPFGIIDGIELALGSRVLVKNQTLVSENGLYVVSAGTWNRALDDQNQFEVFVKNGTQVGTWSIQSGVAVLTSITPNVSIWTESNYWVHRDDLVQFNLTTTVTTQALRPIIEFSIDLELSSEIDHFNKVKFNQAPLFNLYDYNSTPILVNGKQLCSAIFYYQEDLVSPIDQHLQRRVITDNFNFSFSQGLSYNNKTVFFKKSNTLHSIWTKDITGTEVPSYVVRDITSNQPIPYVGNPSTDLNKTGDWLTPFQLNKNPEFENRKTISYGDLTDHLTSIISAQPNLSGSAFGSNNVRQLNQDLGLGGNINLIDNQFNLFMGLLNQQNITPITLIDFAERQYENSLNSLIYFIDLHIGELASKYSNESNLVQKVFNEYKIDYKSKGELQDVYLGSLNPIPNWPMTLPLLGVMSAVQPVANYYNPILFSFVNIHHDGHQSLTYTKDSALEQSLTRISVLRFDGTSTEGFFGALAPARPYKGEFWYDSTTDSLKTFNIDFESSIAPITAVDGQYWYDRTTNILKLYTSGIWVVSNDNRWETFSLSDLYNGLVIHAETVLYDYWRIAQSLQPNIWNLSVPTYDQAKYLGFELSRFAIANGLDPYGSNYDPKDAFTWNYRDSDFGANAQLNGIARWHKIYEAYLGTARPDLEPWKILSLPDNAALLLAAGSTNIWTYILANTTKKICVDPSTGIVLPPYVSSTLPQSQYALITDYTKIINSADNYVFGEEGIVELVWRTTVNFNYSLFRASLKIDPVNCLTKTWGFQTFDVNGLSFDKISKNILNHYEFSLHSEPRTILQNDIEIQVDLITPNTNSYEIDLTVTSTSSSLILLSNVAFGLSVIATGNIFHCHPINAPAFDITIIEKANPLLLGDIIRIVISGNTISASYIPTSTYVYNGLNQTYVNLKKYNSSQIANDYNDYALRRWNARLVYRTNSIIETNTIVLNFDDGSTKLNNTAYEPYLKINNFAKSSWLHALRIQVTQIGTNTAITSSIFKPKTDGSDWVFRVENYFARYPSLEKYITSTSGIYETFNVLDNTNTSLPWNHYLDITGKEIINLPLTITGIQNVVHFLTDYIAFCTDSGWAVGQDDNPETDIQTGRAITWQLEVEKFIDALYKGVTVGQGLVINPFLKRLWFNTPTGLVSNFKHGNYDDISTGQLVYDLVGDVIDPSALMVIRSDEQTSITSEVPMFGCHVNINEYEHILIFNNFNEQSLRQGMLYDGFLGIKIDKLLLNCKRQLNRTNRPTYGGFFLNGSTTSKNLTASVDDMANFYNADLVYNNPVTTPQALELLGYSPKGYFSNLNVDAKSEFNFWRGMISAKGSNYSLDAFINSAKFETAKVDEFWAYKVAEYGDSRQKSFPELKIEARDTVLKHTRLFFAGSENDTTEDAMTVISNDDENRWFTLSDLNSDLYFSAKQLEPFYVSTVIPNQLIQLPFPTDQMIIFRSKNEVLQLQTYVQEINNLASIGITVTGEFIRKTDMQNILDEIDILAASDNAIKAEVVNTSFVRFPIPGDYSIVGYVPMRPTYSPIQLFDYVNNEKIEDVGVWHPAYDIHTPEALDIIDVVSNTDPARYNYSVLTIDNVNYNPMKAWGQKEVGKVWWDTTNRDYVPYFDPYIYPSFEERLTRWGALAEYSDINVYEWVGSNVHPSQYDSQAATEQGDSSINNAIRKTGNVGRTELYKRNRSWQGRAVAWSYVANPSAVIPLQMFSFATDTLHLSSTEIGSTTLVLENGTFLNNQLTSGMHLGGWIINKPYGELVLTAGTGYFVGSSTDIGDENPMTFPSNSSVIFSHFVVKINSNLTAPVPVGQVQFSSKTVGSNVFLEASNSLSNAAPSEIMIVSVDGQSDLNFKDLGFTITLYSLTSSSDYSAIATEIVQSIDLHIRNYQKGNIIIPFASGLLDNQLPVVQPQIFSTTLQLDGLVNIETIDIVLNQPTIGNFSLTSPDGINLVLSNNGNEVQRLALTPITSTAFDIVFDNLTLSIVLLNLTSVENLIAELTDLATLMVVGLDNNIVSFITSNSTVVIAEYNWRAWTVPTTADLAADQSSPFTSWNPVFGDWVNLPPTKDIISSITAYNTKPLTLNSGVTVQVYNSVWSNWEVQLDELNHQYSTGSLLSFTMSSPINQNYFSLYLNGINQLTNTYTLNPDYPTIATLNSIVPIGTKVTAYLRKYQPTTAELAFDPTVKDVPSTLVQYKNDYEYVTQTVRDRSGQITSNMYYFWVKNKSIPNQLNSLTIQQAAILLKFGPSLYLTFQDMRLLPTDGYETMKFFDLSRYEIKSFDNLQVIFKAITIANLGTFVTKDSTYKLRFTQDFTLRDDPKELDLKNTHTEWSLIRPNDFSKIPQKLWDKLVDSACGMDIVGNTIPSATRIDYDKRHGTKTRFGFEADQIFIENNLIISSLLQAITNPKTVKYINGQEVPDTINSIDYATISSWFSTPAATRSFLTQIWNIGTGPQLNGIFFEVLNDALANDYYFSDLFKTSRISVHSITTH